MKLFSKLKDHNSLLEQILEHKTFSTIAKSLLLSMIYKLEVSYKDYSKIKVDAIPEHVFLMNILDVIQKYCDNVKIVEPDSVQAGILVQHNVSAVTNTKERSILSYPTELSMLYALADIEPKYYFMKDEFILKQPFQSLLVTGYKQNTTEILKNFNGWSWDVNPKEQMDYVANMIYQNFMMIVGEKFLYEWRTDNYGGVDYLAKMKAHIRKYTGNDDYYLSLCKLLYTVSKRKRNLKQKFEENEQKYKEFLRQSEEYIKQHIREFNQIKNFHIIYYNENSEYQEMIQLQKYFLKFLEKKIEHITTADEMLVILYQMRYYRNMNFYDGTFVKDCSDLTDSIEHTIKLMITKACKVGLIKIISMDIETNYEIIRYILDTKIINLETIKICIEVEENHIFVKVYDNEIFEKEGKIDFSGNKKDIKIRKNKNVKLFVF